jgi:hypothetical protein
MKEHGINIDNVELFERLNELIKMEIVRFYSKSCIKFDLAYFYLDRKYRTSNSKNL